MIVALCNNRIGKPMLKLTFMRKTVETFGSLRSYDVVNNSLTAVSTLSLKHMDGLSAASDGILLSLMFRTYTVLCLFGYPTLGSSSPLFVSLKT